MLIAFPVFAAAGDPGVNLNKWLQTNVGALIPGAILCIGLFFIITRDWVKMISFIGIALCVAMVMNWTAMKTLADGLFTSVFG